MNKFLNKLTSATLSLTISFVPMKTRAGIVSDVVKLIVNAFGLGLSVYGYRKLDMDIDNSRSQNTVKYAMAAMATFSFDLCADLYDLSSDLSSSKEKGKLEKKIERLEMENSILKSTRK